MHPAGLWCAEADARQGQDHGGQEGGEDADSVHAASLRCARRRDNHTWVFVCLTRKVWISDT